MKENKLVYTAILSPWEEGGGYTVIVPDLPGCISEGDNLAEAIEMGIDAAACWLVDEIISRKEVPIARDQNLFEIEKGDIITLLLIKLDSDEIFEKVLKNDKIKEHR